LKARIGTGRLGIKINTFIYKRLEDVSKVNRMKKEKELKTELVRELKIVPESIDDFFKSLVARVASKYYDSPYWVMVEEVGPREGLSTIFECTYSLKCTF